MQQAEKAGKAHLTLPDLATEDPSDPALSYCCPGSLLGNETSISLPITARRYVYGDPDQNGGITGFLGGKNGYLYEARYWDIVYVFCFAGLVRFLSFLATKNISHQKR